jgi:SAGA-associated factor 29
MHTTLTNKILRAIDDAIERLDVLIALRKASESQPPGRASFIFIYLKVSPRKHAEKRNKRPRGQSPAVSSAPVTPPVTAAGRVVSITLPARNSVGPTGNVPFSRDPKARREALAKQLPLQEGRKVAFHPPPSAGSTVETDENTWILAVVTKCINQDKNRYALQARQKKISIFCADMKFRTQSPRRTDSQDSKFVYFRE